MEVELWTPARTQRFMFEGRVHVWVRGRTTIEGGHPILEGRMDWVVPFEVDYPAPEKRRTTTQEVAAVGGGKE